MVWTDKPLTETIVEIGDEHDMKAISSNKNVGNVQIDIHWKAPHRISGRGVDKEMESALLMNGCSSGTTQLPNANQHNRIGRSPDPYEKDNSAIDKQKMLRSEAENQGKSCYVS